MAPFSLDNYIFYREGGIGQKLHILSRQDTGWGTSLEDVSSPENPPTHEAGHQASYYVADGAIRYSNSNFHIRDINNSVTRWYGYIDRGLRSNEQCLGQFAWNNWFTGPAAVPHIKNAFWITDCTSCQATVDLNNEAELALPGGILTSHAGLDNRVQCTITRSSIAGYATLDIGKVLVYFMIV